MLRKLGSPRNGSRFAAGFPSPRRGKSEAKDLSSLAGSASTEKQGSIQQQHEAKSPPVGRSPKKRMSLWGKKTPSTGAADTTALAAESQSKPAGTMLDLSAAAKIDQLPVPEERGLQSESAGAKLSPLLRSPRGQRSIGNKGDSKITSPANQPEEKKTPRSKRDSFGLKHLVGKREKAEEKSEELAEGPSNDAAPTPNKPDSAKTKHRQVRSRAQQSNEETADLALSPIRRKHRPPTDTNASQPSTTTTIIRDAASLLGRQSMTRADGVPPMQQPEVHFIGEVVGGDGFGKSSDGYCCKWSVDYGNQWIHLAGDQVGQSQIDYADSSEPDTGAIVWAHPIDLHFATTALHGWPKLLLQVWRADSNMKMNVVGYGFTHLPFSPGYHQLTVGMWRPMGTAKEELAAALLGHTPELASDEILFNTAWAERCRLKTIATGRVHVSVGIIVRNFDGGESHLDM